MAVLSAVGVAVVAAVSVVAVVGVIALAATVPVVSVVVLVVLTKKQADKVTNHLLGKCRMLVENSNNCNIN